MIVLLPIVVISPIVAKIGLTAFYALTRPLDSIAYIPSNWRKVALCTDSATIPEFIPEIEEADDPEGFLDTLKLSWWIKGLDDDPKIVRYLIGFPAVGFLYLLAGAYRWSLKSTALIWSPLLWAFKPLKKVDDPAHFAKGILTLSPYRLSRWYSALVIFLFCTKMTIFVLWYQVAESFELLPAWSIVNAYLASQQLPLWQVASFVSAVLTFWIYVRAEALVHEGEGAGTISLARYRRFFQSTFWIRNVLGIYAAVCVLYITMMLASTIKLPPLHPVIFPW